MKTFNIKKVDWLKQPMFFGEEPNTQRFDQQKYPAFERLNQKQLGFFWRPEEISLQKDRNDYASLTKEQQKAIGINDGLIRSKTPTSSNAVIPRFERAKLIDLPAGVLAFRKSGRFSNTSTENPLLARYKANTGPESPPPITVILSK